MRDWKPLTLPSGQTIETTGAKRQLFWERSGVARGTDLTTIKKGHAKKVMALAHELFPDQVPEEDNHGDD